MLGLGKGGGGAHVTELGLVALTRYRAIEAKVLSVVEAEVAAIGELLAQDTAKPRKAAKASG